MARFTFAVLPQRAHQRQPATAMTYIIMHALTAAGHVLNVKAEKGDFEFMTFEIRLSKDEKPATGKPGLIDLGFCPRCKDALDGLRGLKRRIVGNIAFCVFCAWHVENDAVALQRYAVWAKGYKEKPALEVSC